MTLIKEISLPWPDKAMSSNSRAHWAEKSDAVKSARSLAKFTCRNKPGIECVPDAELFMEYYPALSAW